MRYKLWERKENYSSAEGKKGINAFQRCSVENQKGAIARLCTAIAAFWLEGHYHQTLYSNCGLLVLNGTSLNSVNALLALSQRIGEAKSVTKKLTINTAWTSLARVAETLSSNAVTFLAAAPAIKLAVDTIGPKGTCFYKTKDRKIQWLQISEWAGKIKCLVYYLYNLFCPKATYYIYTKPHKY